jgi:tetratricopeptide (TPR) repeat protein
MKGTLLFTALTLLGFALLQGCTSVGPAGNTPPVPRLTFDDEDRYGMRPQIPQPAELLALTTDQREKFLAYVNDPARKTVPAHERIYDYLEAFTRNYRYQADTLTATEAFAVNGGNCMSLALMTTALADLANVSISYQLLADVPVFEWHGTVVEKGLHVRSLLHAETMVKSDGNSFVFNRSTLKIDYFPTGNERRVSSLDREGFLAMYYANIASDAIAVQDYTRAYWFAREALLLAPLNAAVINTLAVISRRSGDEARAEQLYRFGISQTEDKLTLLKNYQLLLKTQGRTSEAEQIGLQLARIDDPSPFHWFQLARTAYDAKEYEDAIRYYRRALAVAPYLHEAYAGMALSQHQIGHDAAAIASIKQALDNVFRPATRQLYKAKLYALLQAGG